jgi:hypothetical protein
VRAGILVFCTAQALASCNDVAEAPVEFDDRPYANNSNARKAATDCGLEEWHWVKSRFTFDGPQTDQRDFAYELPSLPSEEVEAKNPRERARDRLERIHAIEECLDASFEKQGVRAYISAPALLRP